MSEVAAGIVAVRSRAANRSLPTDPPLGQALYRLTRMHVIHGSTVKFAPVPLKMRKNQVVAFYGLGSGTLV